MSRAAVRACCTYPVTLRPNESLSDMSAKRVKSLPVAFDPLWRAASDDLRATITGFVELLDEHERRQNTRSRARKPNDREKFCVSVECIAVNLLAVNMAENGARLAVPLANSASARSEIFGKHFNAALDLMTSMGLLSRETGHRISRAKRRASTVMARKSLFKHLPDPAQLSWDAFKLLPDPQANLLTLRRAKDHDSDAQRDLTFAETADTERIRAEIEALNVRLASAPISFAGADPRGIVHFTPGGDTMRRLVTVHHRAVRRIFNNGDTSGADWSEGGRLAGGFWATLERSQRFAELRLAGEAVVSVDFEQLFLRLAYAGKGLSPSDQMGDLYKAGPGRREGWKIMTNALLFGKAAPKSWPGGDTSERAKVRGYFPKGTTPAKVVQAIKEKHGAIADCFECGLGFRLMRQESDILLAALERLAEQGIPALPLHDAVLVPKSMATRARATMEQEALRITGSPIPCKIEKGTNHRA